MFIWDNANLVPLSSLVLPDSFEWRTDFLDAVREVYECEDVGPIRVQANDDGFLILDPEDALHILALRAIEQGVGGFARRVACPLVSVTIEFRSNSFC